MRDFYEVLGVTRTAEHETIRRAYRRLARQYHPDLNPAAAEQFKEISAAYDVLSDPARRAMYDEFGDVSLKPGFDPVVARYAGLGQGRGGAAASSADPDLQGQRTDAFNEFFANLNRTGPSTGTTAGTTPYRGSDPGPDPTPAPGAPAPGMDGWGGGMGSTAGTTPYRGSAGERVDPSSFRGSTSGTTPYRGSAGERVDPSSFQGSTSGTTPYRGSAQESGYGTGFSRSSQPDTYFPGKQYGDGGRPRSGAPAAAPSAASGTPSPDPYQQRMTGARPAGPAPSGPMPTPGRGGAGGMHSPYTSGPMPTPGEDLSVVVEISLLESLHGTARELTVERTLRDGRRQQESLRVNLKAGVSDGEEIRMRGRGHQGRSGGSPGDLVVTIQVRSTGSFRREGYDLHLDVPITLLEALVGAKIEVPTPDGLVRVMVPANTMSGRRLRLRQRGVSVGNGERGDLYLILRPTPPSSSDPEVRRLIEALERFYPRTGVRADLDL